MKQRVVATGQAALAAATCGVALLVVGSVTFILDVVVNRTAAVAVGGALLLVAVVLLAVVPRELSRSRRTRT